MSDIHWFALISTCVAALAIAVHVSEGDPAERGAHHLHLE